MSAETAPAPGTRSAGAFTLLALGVAGPPVAWWIDLQTSYALVPWACHSGRHAFLHLVPLALALVIVTFATLSWRTGRDGRGQVSAFLSHLAAGIAAMFLLALLANELARLLLDPCL